MKTRRSTQMSLALHWLRYPALMRANTRESESTRLLAAG